jgi:hypothetical protein
MANEQIKDISETRDDEILKFEFPRWRARELDLLCCANCGWRENNHFDHGKRKCAFDPKCPGYVEQKTS